MYTLTLHYSGNLERLIVPINQITAININNGFDPNLTLYLANGDCFKLSTIRTSYPAKKEVAAKELEELFEALGDAITDQTSITKWAENCQLELEIKTIETLQD